MHATFFFTHTEPLASRTDDELVAISPAAKLWTAYFSMDDANHKALGDYEHVDKAGACDVT